MCPLPTISRLERCCWAATWWGAPWARAGFGITYIGYDLRLELKVAIKEYYPVDRATRNSAVSLSVTSFVGPSSQSFQRGKEKYLVEARAMAKMDKQQAIVSVRDFFEENNTAYIVMEYIDGTTFCDLVKQRGPHPARGAVPPAGAAFWGFGPDARTRLNSPGTFPRTT